MAGVSLRQRVVEVIADLGETGTPQWRYGSGLLIGGRQVLTAAHVVASAVAVTVRGPDKVALPADLDTSLVGEPDRLDLALVAVPTAHALPGVAIALVDRDVTTGDVIEGCWAVGYPSFQEVASDAAGSVRETAQVWGWIPPLSGLVQQVLSLQVTATPQSLPAEQTRLGESEWSGMSGAAVFVRELLVGVVTEHAPRRGSSEVTVIPLDRLIDPATAPADAAGWWARLGVDNPAGLPKLPAVPARPEPAYRATLRILRGRTKVLVGRQNELAQITAFAGGADDAFGPDTVSDGYLWLVGGPWAGKTALLAEAVHSMPGSVDVVAFFLVRREGRASREQFLGAVVPQLAWLLDQDSPGVVDVDVFNDLWERAAQQAEANDRRLLLVVDGLDEDLRPDGRSVAALLPTQGLGLHARVLVASRPYLELPNDVEAHHPLRIIQRTQTQVLLKESPDASELQVLAEQEIKGLLESVPARDPAADLIQGVLGVITAAAGPLSVEDLVALTSHPKRMIREFVTNQAARSLEPVGSENDRGYQFAHQTLLRLCEGHPDIGGEPQYRNRLHAWAEHWRDQGWLAPGVDGAGTPRYLLDAYPAVLAGDPTDPLRPAHPERLATLVSDINWVDSAVCCVGVDGVLVALRTAAQFSPVQAPVASMLRLLQLQADQLRPPSGMNRPGGSATQLAWEALRNDLPDLAHDAATRLRRSPAPLLIPMWTTEHTSPYLVRVLGRHDDSVYAVAVGPNGRVITAGGDGLRLWDLAAPGQPGQELGRRNSPMFSVAVGPDGQVISGGEDGVVWLWDLAAGEPGQELGRHGSRVNAVAVGPGRRVVSGGDDGVVWLWDLAAPGQPGQELGRHDGAVYAVAVGPGGQVVTGGEDWLVRLWDLAAPGQPGQELGRHDGAVSSVVVGPDGQVVTGGEDGVVRLWDLAAPGQPGQELGRRNSPMFSVAVGPDGQVVIAGRGVTMFEMTLAST